MRPSQRRWMARAILRVRRSDFPLASRGWRRRLVARTLGLPGTARASVPRRTPDGCSPADAGPCLWLTRLVAAADHAEPEHGSTFPVDQRSRTGARSAHTLPGHPSSSSAIPGSCAACPALPSPRHLRGRSDGPRTQQGRTPRQQRPRAPRRRGSRRPRAPNGTHRTGLPLAGGVHQPDAVRRSAGCPMGRMPRSPGDPRWLGPNCTTSARGFIRPA